MPMQTLVAGAEMISTGTCNQPIPPSMHSGTSVKLRIIAIATRTDRATIHAMTMNNAFSQKRWQRNHRADVPVIFERAVQRPHLLVSGIGVEFASVGGGDNERERITADAMIDIVQAVPQFGARFEIIEKTRVGIYFFETESQRRADQNHSQREQRVTARPKRVRRFRLGDFASARHGPAQKWRVHYI